MEEDETIKQISQSDNNNTANNNINNEQVVKQ